MPRPLSRPACLRQAEQVARKACASEPGWADCLKQVLPTIEQRMCPAPPPRAPRNPARAACRPKCAKPNRPADQSLAECIAACVREIDKPPSVSAPIPAEFCGTVEERRRTDVITPQATEPARYALMDAADLVASHDPGTFAPDPRYPREVQERLYQVKKSEQAKVNFGAKELRPSLLLHRAPTPADGPPLVTSDGCVLGGNGRSMMLKLAYRNGDAGRYREDLACRAAEFGFSRRDVEAADSPVLVRVIDGLRCDSPTKTLADAVRRYNLALTNALDEVAQGVSESRLLSPATVAMFGSMVEGERTLKKAMTEEPAIFLRALTADGIVTRQERDRWATETGALTDGAKNRIEAMYLAKVMGSAERIRSTPDHILQKVEKAVPYLLAVETRNPQYGQVANFQKALDLINISAGAGHGVEATMEAGELSERAPAAGFGGAGALKGDPTIVAFARTIEQRGINQIRDRFRAWASSAGFDPKETTIGSVPPPTIEEARAMLVGDARPDAKTRNFLRNMLVQQPEGIAEISAVYDGKTAKEGGSGVKHGHVRLRYLFGPRKGAEAEVPLAEVGDTVKR